MSSKTLAVIASALGLVLLPATAAGQSCYGVPATDPAVCGSHGDCVADDTCLCDTGWAGEQCEIPVCNPVCNNGICVSPGMCVCESG